MNLADPDRGGVEQSGSAVVPQTLPCRDHGVLTRLGHGASIWKQAEKTLETFFNP